MPTKVSADVEIFSLYNGEVELRFKPSSHRTTVIDRGIKIQPPSVTTVLDVLNKPALVEWGVRCACDFMDKSLRETFAGESFSLEGVLKLVDGARGAHNRIKQEAADIGTAAHDWLAQYWKVMTQQADTLTILDEGPVRNCTTAALDWFSKHKVQPIIIEYPQYSRKFQITGRPDFVGLVDGELSVIDYKSTKAIWPEVALQMAPYARMYEEEHGVVVSNRWALRMDKITGEFQDRKYPADTLDLDMDTFLYAFKIYNRLKHLRRKPKPEPDTWIEELEAA